MNSQQSELSAKRFEKISGFLDGELTQQEAQKVALMIETEPESKQLFDELSLMRHQVQSLSLQEQELEHLDRLFKEPAVKISRILGLVLVALTGASIVAFTFFKIFTNPEIGLIEKILVGALGTSSLLLLFSVLRQRVISAKNDKYKRVKI